MKLKKIIMLGGVGLVSAIAGIAVPQMMSGKTHDAEHAVTAEPAHGQDADKAKKEKEKKEKEKNAAPKADSHAAAGHGAADAHGKPGAEKPHSDGPSFVTFGRAVVNLNDPNLVRWLLVEVTLQVDGDDEEETTEAVKARSPLLKTWLISHLADKTVEDIRGKIGVNRLRREIQDNFNALLFTDGRERIRDIHFEEFEVR